MYFNVIFSIFTTSSSNSYISRFDITRFVGFSYMLYADIEKELAETLLAQNDGNVERTINFLLEQKSGGTTGETDQQIAQRHRWLQRGERGFRGR